MRYHGMENKFTSPRPSYLPRLALRMAACIGIGIFSSAVFAASSPQPAQTTDRPVEIHQRLVVHGGENAVALTLDACGGGFDADLIATLIEFHVPATIFATRKWIDRHPEGIALLNAHRELFAIEDHGAAHIPAVIGVDKRVYGLRGEPDIAHLQDEIEGGANAIASTGAPKPNWYRGATARYDQAAVNAINAMGYRIAGFSVNADAGATLPRRAIFARLRSVQPGDIILAHMNKPASESAEGLRDALPGMLQRGLQFVTLRWRAVETLAGGKKRR